MNTIEDRKIEGMLRRLGNYECDGQISMFGYMEEEQDKEQRKEMKEPEEPEL